MTANQTPLRPQRVRKPDPVPTRPVTELLLKLAYHLHTTRVVARATDRSSGTQTQSPHPH
jgi:hypothetical protein